MPYYLFIVPAAARAAARAFAIAHLDPVHGAQTLLGAVSADGTWPPTHYHAGCAIPDQLIPVVETIEAQIPGARVIAYDPATDPGLFERTLAEMGLTYMQPAPPAPLA